ncbi:MAG: penicillin-binding protein 2 [Deltaproteobacteria bacterium]|nr:penicillin-binding protein 2 [Deltaproteobacteria bacterium]
MKLSDPYNVSELRARAIVVSVLFGVMLGLLLLRLWYLQIWQGETYREFSDRNRFKIEKLSAPRGQLLDRNGKLLADSRPRFDLTFVRGNAQNLEYELKLLQNIFHWTDPEFEKRMAKITQAPMYQAQSIAQDLTPEQLALVESQSLELPAVDVEVIAVRDYLYEDSLFHILGYTGEINDRELESLRLRFPERNYKLGDQKGIIGIESLYEGFLRGQDGRDFIVVDVKGRRVNQDQWRMLPSAVRIEPVAGKTLQLTLDQDLQLETVKAFKNQVGSAVAIDPKTGQILAYVSRPALNPNIFTKPISNSDFDSMMKQSDNPFLDRVVGEHYPPGSTLKLIMAAAGLESGSINPNTTFYCPGFFRFGNRVWKCWKHEGHGKMNVVSAIARSCDVFFYNAALLLGLDSMFSWSLRFGMGRRSYIGSEVFSDNQSRPDRLARFNTEASGFIPSVDWVLSKRLTSVEAETINAGIGQGAFTTTIIQLARMIAALGNGGKVFQPQLVLNAQKPSGEVIRNYQSQLESHFILSEETKKAVLQGIEDVIGEPQGTAHGSRIPGVHFGGKTGTAQVVALDLSKSSRRVDYRDHALFVGLAPIDDPKIAVAVIVEHGEHGASAAAPIAKMMVKTYLDKLAAEAKTEEKPIEKTEGKAHEKL